MTTGEGIIKREIKKILTKHKVYWHMPIQNGMGAPSLDFICCVKGWYLGIEAKAPHKKPTVRQLNTMGQILSAGGIAIVIDSMEMMAYLEGILEGLESRRVS